MADYQEYYDPDSGTFYRKKIWRVYILFNGDDIIYIGCTNNLISRLKSHKLSKTFDSYIIYFAALKKDTALEMENRIISFCYTYTKHPILNKNKGYNHNNKIPI
jgi:predicted GIY-YIG superfamily endonuclease